MSRLYSKPQPTQNENDFERNYQRAVYEIFHEFALEDQQSYYARKMNDNRAAARTVNFWRAFFSFMAGVASALMALIVGVSGVDCTVGVVSFTCVGLGTLAIVSVVAPAIGAAFTTLGDLYQWDRTSAIYEVAIENLKVADAESPDEGEDDAAYRAALVAYTMGTLQVMKDETAQWGTLIRTPQQLENFVNSAVDQANQQQQRRADREDEARWQYREQNPDTTLPPLNRLNDPGPTPPTPPDETG